MSGVQPGPRDRVTIHPAPLDGTVDVAGDKSLGHRCLLIGSLADGPVGVAGLATSADIAATAEGLRRLGVNVELEPDGDGRLIGVVEGPIAPGPDASLVTIDCGNSGTTLRLLAGLAAGAGRHVVLDGDASLRKRPVGRVMAPLAAMGVHCEAREDRFPPLTVRGTTVSEARWESPVASAQVKSAVLLAAVAGRVGAEIVSPAPSRDHTERMLVHGGMQVATQVDTDGRERVRMAPGRPRFTTLSAPRDPSAAAFWHVAAACGAGTVKTRDICLNPGRTGALDVLRAMGADVRVTGERTVDGEPVGDVTVAPGALSGAEIAGALVVRCLDELPVLALAGALSDDGLVVRDAGELRVKESDRIGVLAATLRTLSIDVTELPDGFVVPGGQRPRGGAVDAHGDHRIAMTAAVAACVGTAPVHITGFAAVGTSYPGFLSDLSRLGGRAEVLDD